MTRKLLLPAMATILLCCGTARAQLLAPYPYSGGGVGFTYNGGRLRVGGLLQSWYGGPYIAPLGYGMIQRQVIVQPIVPVTVAPSPPAPKYDLSGIDLDVESPDKLYPPGKSPLPKPAPAERNRVPRGPEKLPAPKPELPEPKPPKAEPPKPPPPRPPPEDELLKPRAIPAEESIRLVKLGERSFRAGAYGLALWRFRQASEIDRTNARAFFLMGQALMAGGHYRDALTAIQDGLRLQPDWPTSDYRPRDELYGENADDWQELTRRLEDAVRRHPNDPAFLFLRAYTLWFDGQRAEAAQWFIKARARTADPRWIDLFLKHAPAAVAAS